MIPSITLILFLGPSRLRLLCHDYVFERDRYQPPFFEASTLPIFGTVLQDREHHLKGPFHVKTFLIHLLHTGLLLN